MTKGLKRVTVDDLTKAAGFTRGAFYSNFESVDEVFFEVFRAHSEGLLTRARASVDAAVEVDLEFVLDLMQEMSGDRTWLVLQAEFTLLALRDEGAHEVLTAFTEELRAEFAEMIALVMERLGRRPVRPLAQLAQVVVGLQNQLASATALGHLVAGPEGEATKDLVREVLTVLVTQLSEPLAG